MEFLKSIDLETWHKIFIGASGVLVVFLRLRESLSVLRRKQELKTDLEIYELSKSNNLSTTALRDYLEKRINQLSQANKDHLSSFITGAVVFVGFGLWSIDIYTNSNDFNGWIILTIACSLIGLLQMLGRTDEKKTKETFLQIHFKDKSNFQFGVFITLLCGITTPILFLKSGEFTFWQFLTALFFMIGLFSLMKNITIVK